jgi:hypothetical protein
MIYKIPLLTKKYQEISNEINLFLEKVFDDIHTPSDRGFIVYRLNYNDFLSEAKLFTEFLDQNQLKIKTMACLKILGTSSIHIDGDQKNFHVSSKTARLQWAVKNCDDTLTKIYKFKENKNIPDNSTVSIYADGKRRTFMDIKDQDCIEVDEFYLNSGPIIWWPNRDPHKVINDQNKIRISVTFGLI